MDKFIDNVNKYICHYSIKQSAMSLKTGINSDKLSRILNREESACLGDMEKIACSLGKSVEYFLKDMDLTEIKYNQYSLVTFNTENVTKEKEEFANKVFDFLEHIEAILGIPKKIEKCSRLRKKI